MADSNDHSLEVVSFQDDIGDLTRYIGPGIAHGNANISGFKGRTIVDTIAGHGDHLACLLQRLHDLQLVRGADAGKDVHATGERGHDLWLDSREMCRIKNFELLSTRQTEFLANRVCCRALIAGNHDRSDTSLVEVLDSVLHPLAYWVSHTNQS